jgi:hypothetical protein
MDFLKLSLGLGATWVVGAAIMDAMTRRGAPERAIGELAWIVGCGWFVGAFVVTLWMRVLTWANVPFSVISIGGPIVVVCAALLAWRRSVLKSWRGVRDALAGRHLSGWRRAAWIVILVWIATRFGLLLNEVVMRPLYPWDAWSQWGSKARVWFELRTMAPFITTSEWLQANSAKVYFDAGPHYPGTVPLMQVWPAVLVGRWDDSLINLPWWLTGVAFALAIYGYLARERFEPLAAMVGTWLLVSLPFLEVHVALAGYADLAMSTYFTLAVLWVLNAARTRTWQDAVVAVFFLVASIAMKNPGKFWVATLVPGLVTVLVPRHGMRIVAALFLGAIGILLVLAYSEARVLGYYMHLDFEMPWRALFDAYFTFGNWNMLAYGAVALAILARKQLLSPAIAPFTVTLAAGILFLFGGFSLTNVGAWVEDQSTINRATLILVPLTIL